MRIVDLSGTWRASVADEERRRSFADVDIDDSDAAGWHDLPVPSHWRTVPAFADTDGPLLTRRTFTLDPSDADDLPRRIDADSARTSEGDGDDAQRIDVDSLRNGQGEAGQRSWLVLDGVAYQGDVWIDGRYVGDTEGYFFAHGFDVTDLMSDGPEHVVAIEVACSPHGDPTAKRNLTGALQDPELVGPDWNPGGIWRGVRLEQSGPLRIRHLKVRCTEATPDHAVLAMRAVIDAREPGAAELRTTVERTVGPDDQAPTSDPTDHVHTQVLAAGENRVEWTVEIDDPDLWWPHALGIQPLYDVRIEVGEQDATEVTRAQSHQLQVRTGLRTIELDDWILRVNGQRMFVKGTNIGPARLDLAGATAEEIAADVAAAKDLGLDLVRVHSHISRPELYAAADEAGMLVWQDLPLRGGYARSVRQQAVRQAREAVDLLAHHPSVAIWCGHDAPPGEVLPSWNRTILDRSIRRTLRSVDGTRPVIAHSGVLPHLPQLDGTDAHLRFGWEYGDIDDLARLAARWPRLVRFVSGLGAQAVPDTDDFCEPHRWPDLDWERLTAVHGLRRDLLDLVADPADADSFDEWRLNTQRYQAELVRRQVEALRRLKYRPTGGFTQSLLSDARPSISRSVIDHAGRPKLGHEALAAACRPVIVVADPLPHLDADHHVHDLPVAIHVVSDRRVAIVGATVTAELDIAGRTALRHQWAGDIQSDSCTRVGELVADLCDAEPGSVTLRLRLHDPDGSEIAANEYRR